MEPLNGDAAHGAGLRQQIEAYLADCQVPAARRTALAGQVAAALPAGLEGPHLWLAIQRLTDRALARDEGIDAAEDHRLLARARLGYVLGAEGARHALPESEPALASPLAEADRFSVPRPVPHRMRPQPLRFWSPRAAQALIRRLGFGSRLRPES